MAGAAVASRSGRRGGGRAGRILAALLALVGLGSVAFHGPQPLGSRWIHDWSIVVLLTAMAATALVVDGIVSGRRGVLITAEVASVVGAALVVVPDIGLVAIAVCAAGVAVIELVRRPAGRVGPVLVGIFVAAIAVQLLGRSGGPLCEPDTWLQPHAVWHLLSATGLAIWIDRVSAGSRVA